MAENTEQGTNAKQTLLARLTKLPVPSAEEQALLSHLQLTLEHAGLQALEINTYEKKEKLVQLNITCHGERELFEVTEEQKQHLLDFGCNKLKLTEEQAERLKAVHPDTFKTFPLTGQQKNILNSLAPLIREDKYSEESLNLLKSLNLKPANQTFLVQEEIIPDPHTSFGKSKSSYLPLKEKFLQGEQRIIRAKEEVQAKKLNEEQIKDNKLSILRNLMEFAQNHEGKKEAVKKAIKQLSNDKLPSEQQSNRMTLLLSSYPNDNQRETIQNLNLQAIAQQEEENITETTKNPEPSQSSSSTANKYDDLLSGLSAEEAERQRKKLERDEFRRKLEESELVRRQSKLSEKDRKLKEDQERRQQERELAEQEEAKREEARLARESALREERANFLKTQQKNFEEQQKKREENFTNQQKETEIAEKKKQAAIDELDKQNKFQQEKLEKDKKLLEEETQKKLEQIKTEDETEKQKILKQHQERMATLEKEKLENDRLLEAKKKREEEELTSLKEKNRHELKEAQIKLDAERAKSETELERLKEEDQQRKQREKDLQKEREQDQFRGEQRRKEFAISFDEVKYDTKLDGKPVKYEFVESRSLGGYLMMPTLKEIFDRYPGVSVKLGGVENLAKKRIGGRPMNYDDIKNIKKLADRFPGFFTKEE
ncbi:13962_t:CDS:2 [Funneliformis geosporum]|nr:13962_t:CDS:2 [Funneliformis geosporum]